MSHGEIGEKIKRASHYAPRYVYYISILYIGKNRKDLVKSFLLLERVLPWSFSVQK